MNIEKRKKARRLRRKKHIRKTILGTNERPRLTVSKSASHFYAQLINDDEGVTLLSASSLDKEIRDQIKEGTNKMQISKIVGEALAKRAQEANIKSVSFDRNGYLYHGRIKTFADAAREAGLEF